MILTWTFFTLYRYNTLSLHITVMETGNAVKMMASLPRNTVKHY